MTRRSRRSLLPRLALVAVGLALGLVVGEVWLRGMDNFGERERLASVSDAPLGTLLRATFALEKDPGKTRILFIGDSGTEGTGVRMDQAFPARFKQLLDVRHPDNDVESINAGVWGMTTIDEYDFLKDQLLGLRPDIVVLGLFMSNDINFNLGHAQGPVRSGPIQRMLTGMRQKSALAHLVYLRVRSLNNRYGLFDSSGTRWSSLVPRELRLVDSAGFNMVNYPVGETATYLKQPSALMDHAYKVLDQVFADFVELGDANGFAFRVLIIPSPSAITGELTLLHFQQDTYRFLEQNGVRVSPDQLDFSIPTRRVLEICERRGIVCVDPTESMRNTGLRAFFPEDEHSTPLGHDILARELVAQWELIR